MSGEAPLDERVCAAEVIGALCLATDLGMGLPFEHGLQSTLIAMRLAERLGVDDDRASQTYYASLAARRRGSELGISNVEYRVIDAERIELDSDAVDGVLCRFGYMLMADPAAALRETRRVLRAGGRLTLAVWGPPERNPFFTAAAMALVQRGHISPPAPGGPGIFALASEQHATARLADAGFGDVHAEEVAVRFAIPDAEEYVQFVADTAGPLGVTLQALSDAERAAVKAQCAAALEHFQTPSGYEIPGVALCAAAR